jgi:CRISPR/Cas system-associated exonuclease Cas4 (RecB family)
MEKETSNICNLENKKLVSASDIALWSFCPRAYYFERIQKIPTLPNEKLVIGSIIHKIYKEFFREFITINNKESYIKDFLNYTIPVLVNSYESVVQELNLDRNKLTTQMQTNLNNLVFRINTGFSSIPKILETTFASKGLVARPDCVFENNGNFYIGDIKLEGNNNLETKLQLTVGAIVVENELGKSVPKGVIINGQDWNEIIVNITEDLKELVFDIKDNIIDFRSKPYLPKTEYNSYKCKSCSFKHLCKVNGGDNNRI